MREQNISPNRNKILITLVIVVGIILLVVIMATCSLSSPAPVAPTATSTGPYDILEKRVDDAFSATDEDPNRIPATKP